MLKKLRRHWTARWFAWACTATTGLLPLIPSPAGAGSGVARPRTWGLKPGQSHVAPGRAAAAPQPDARVLTDREMESIRGAGPYRNKYLAGAPMPWHRSYRDINLCTGNLFKSFTDIQVAPARGAGLVLQRTYNSQDERVGPFGVGWTHAYDIRVADPNADATDRVDFFGGEHTYTRDADGLYTPPSFMYDELSSDYDTFLVNGPPSVLDDTDKGMDGTVKHFVRNGNERVCDSITDRHGNTTTLTYGLAVTIGGVTRNLLTAVTDPSGRSLNFTWTNLGSQNAPAWRITQVAGPQYSVSYSYNNDLNLSSVTLDPSGLNRTTTYGYTSYTGAAGTATGLLASITDPIGNVVSFGYGVAPTDPTGTVWATQVTEPASGGTVQWTITPVLASSSEIRTSVSDWTHTIGVAVVCDAQLRATYVSAGWDAWLGGQVYRTTYDSCNNVVSKESSTYPDQSTTCSTIGSTSTYGPHGNVLTTSVKGFTNQTTTYTCYNASQYFQKASVTDPQGHVTSFGVGATTDSIGNRGEILWVRDARYGQTGEQFEYAYDTFGRKTSETNLNNVVTQYTYGDQWGNLTQVVQDPGGLGRTTLMSYDVSGKVLASTDPMGRTSSFTYNLLGQPLTASFPAPNPEGVSYAYAANGRMTSVTDNRGATTIAYENGSDRVSSVTDPVTGAVGYTYLPNGERASMTLPGGNTWTYQYDGPRASSPLSLPSEDPNAISHLLKSITDDQGRVVDYTLDQAGRPLRTVGNKVFQNNQLVSYQQSDYGYDLNAGGYSHGYLVSLSNTYHWLQNGTWQSRVLSRNDYGYSTLGQRLTNLISDQNGPVRTETYGYDEINRLTTVNYGDGGTQSYAFDNMGNRLTKVNNGTPEAYAYNNANMLLTRGGNAYTNDANGNTLTGGGRTNTWDSQNRLVQCAFNGTTTTSTYAADGLRHRSVTGTNTTDMVLDQTMQVRELLNGAVKATYLVGPRGPEYRRDDQAGTIRWYVYDGLGSVVGEAAPDGTLTRSQTFDVYGAVRTSTGTATSKHKFVGSLGHPSDDETGLIYMRARHYDPVCGRFVSEDPACYGKNWFEYCGGNPVTQVDESGREWSLPGQATVNTIGLSLAQGFASGLANLLKGQSFAAGFVAGALAGLVGQIPVVGGVLGAFLSTFLNSVLTGTSPFTAFKQGLVSAGVGGFITLGAVFGHIDLQNALLMQVIGFTSDQVEGAGEVVWQCIGA